MKAQQSIVRKENKKLIGHTERVFLESFSDKPDNLWTARSTRLAPEVDGSVYIPGFAKKFKPGDFTEVIYTESKDYDMFAEFTG